MIYDISEQVGTVLITSVLDTSMHYITNHGPEWQNTRVEISVTVHKPELTMSVSGRASQNQGRRTDVREVNQGNAFMQVSQWRSLQVDFYFSLKYLVGGVVSARKAMNAPDHTRSNKWAAHVKIQKMNQKQEVPKVQRLISFLV